jgi:hypothetical protein
VACLTLACLAGSALWSELALADDSFGSLAAEVHVSGMTFVGSRDNVEEFVVRAARGVFVPGTRVAHLQEVDIASAAGPGGQDFSVRCDRGELNVETRDFLAEGHVEGRIADGRRYSAPWVRYDHAKSLLFTDAPVVMHDATGTFRGDGFRYFVSEQRFRLLGNVSMVQTP